MKHSKAIRYIIFGIVVGFLFGLFLCDSDDVIEVRYDSLIYQFDTIPIPEPYKELEYRDTTLYDTIFLNDTSFLYHDIDTALILSDWLKTRLYGDTIRTEEMVLYWNAVVQFNRLKDFNPSMQILRPTEIIHNPNSSINIGVGYYGTFIPYVGYNYKDWGVSVGYNKEIYLGISYKLYEF